MRIRETEPAGVRPDWVSDELFPFESRFVELDGHCVHYVDEGDGPTLLMLHGNPTWSFLYRHVISDLRADFRCIAMDYPGFGLSSVAPGYRFTPEEHAAVLSAFIEELDLTDITVLLHDWGGPIGLTVATGSPGRFSRLVVANTWGWRLEGGLPLQIFSRLIGGPIGRALMRRFNLFVNQGIPRGHRKLALSEAEMQHYRAALGTPRRREASAAFPRAFTASHGLQDRLVVTMPVLQELPVLVLWADCDGDLTERELDRWTNLRPDATVVTLAGVGHYLQDDAPGEYVAAVREWLTTAH